MSGFDMAAGIVLPVLLGGLAACFLYRPLRRRLPTFGPSVLLLLGSPFYLCSLFAVSFLAAWYETILDPPFGVLEALRPAAAQAFYLVILACSIPILGCIHITAWARNKRFTALGVAGWIYLACCIPIAIYWFA